MQTDDGRRRGSRAHVLLSLGLVALVALSGIAGGAVRARNRLVAGHEAVRTAWGHLDSALQRRADLVPALCAVAQAQSAYEGDLLSEVTAARDAYLTTTGADRVTEARRLDRAIADVRIRIEAQPAVGSSTSWARLRTEMVGSDNRIAIERRRYNQAVRNQRILLRSVPGRILAPIVGLNELPEY